jgi:hypothetical protein
MNPIPIQMASNRIAYPCPKCRKAKMPRMIDNMPLMKFKNLLLPETGRANASAPSATPDTTRYTPNNTAATTIDGPGHARITAPR